MNNLDEILKQQMQDFAPDAPNVWAGIEQNMQANAAAQGGGSASKVVFSKMAFTTLKVIAVLTIPVAVATYFYSKNIKTEKSTQPLNSIIKEPLIAVVPGIISEKPLAVKEIKETAVKVKKVKSLINANKAYIVAPNNNMEQVKEIIEEQHKEISNNQIPEKILVVPIVSSVQVEEDLDDKVDSIENTENKIEATEISKNTSTFIKITNVLTPNNDGLNDRYVVEIEGEKLFNLKIYNFNNELVFESNDKNFTWDGVSQKTGQACNSGIYYGVLNFKFINSDKLQTQMTKIKLIR